MNESRLYDKVSNDNISIQTKILNTNSSENKTKRQVILCNFDILKAVF